MKLIKRTTISITIFYDLDSMYIMTITIISNNWNNTILYRVTTIYNSIAKSARCRTYGFDFCKKIKK